MCAACQYEPKKDSDPRFEDIGMSSNSLEGLSHVLKGCPMCGTVKMIKLG